MFVDLIGTLHTELNKPAVLQPKHLMQYRTNMARGFSVFPPEVSNMRIIAISETSSVLIMLVLAKFAIGGRSKSCMQQHKQVTQQLHLFSRGVTMWVIF